MLFATTTSKMRIPSTREFKKITFLTHWLKNLCKGKLVIWGFCRENVNTLVIARKNSGNKSNSNSMAEQSNLLIQLACISNMAAITPPSLWRAALRSTVYSLPEIHKRKNNNTASPVHNWTLMLRETCTIILFSKK